MYQGQQKKQLKYKVPYRQCAKHGQKLNYICLDKKCYERSIICSICKDEQHIKHNIRPLKYYLQQLREKYQKSQEESNLNNLLDQLQISQYTFYQKLKKAVEEVALEFQKLQQQVIQQINSIRNQIFQQIAKRSRFNEFYSSLKQGNIDNSNFIIQNYLPQSTVGKISNLDRLQKLSQQICAQIQQTKAQIISRQQIDGNKKQKKATTLFTHLDLNTCIKRPNNIYFDGNVLTQNQIYGGNSLCLIDYPVFNLSGKLSFKILQLKKASQLLIGVVPKAVYESMNQKWTVNKLDNQSYIIGHDGFQRGWTKTQITQFSQGSTLQLSYRSGDLKIVQKNKCCSVKMPTQTQLFVIVALIGQCQVRVSHLK